MPAITELPDSTCPPGGLAAGSASLFPVPAVRAFYKLELPRGALGSTLLITALGAAALTGFWVLSRREGRGTAVADRE